jgi:CheY-like chemotaxis protein
MINDQYGRWQASIEIDRERKPAKVAAPEVRNSPLAVRISESKTVLLVDSNPRTRESRAKVFRTRGLIVHCASNAQTARNRVATAVYDLVLVDLGQDFETAEKLVQEIRANNPRQRAGFLVGRPSYIATSLKRDSTQQVRLPEAETALPAKRLEYLSDFGQRVRDAEAKAGL